MNPDTNRFEPLHTAPEGETTEHRRNREVMERMLSNGGRLLRPNGDPVPKHWSTFTLGELVVIKDYTFKVAYIGETAITFEPVGPTLLGEAVPAAGDPGTCRCNPLEFAHDKGCPFWPNKR